MTTEHVEYPILEWSEIDCYLMEADGWVQDGPVRGGMIHYKRNL